MAQKGFLQVQCFKENSYVPVDNVKITVSQKVDGGVKTAEFNERTNSSGQTGVLELDAPPMEYSQQPSNNLPYSLADVMVEPSGFDPVMIRGCQIYPERTALQPCNLKESSKRQANEEVIDIPPNKLSGNYPPKIPEPIDTAPPVPPTGFVVLPEPVVPQFIVVHAGSPDDPSAPNYTVRYREYIKNVASSEIYSTWPDTTIRANVYCIISFTLNRIYTEWYRGKGKNFDITNSTAYDHAFAYGRNIYENISKIVDDIFTTYIKRPDKEQPLLTQYCDGRNVQCPGWLTQWGSKDLGDQGMAPFDILTNFYGPDITLSTAQKVKGTPKSYPGAPLKEGSRGTDVRDVQSYLNRIAQDYPLIPKLAEDGAYGAKTKESVQVFQGVFNLNRTGIVDYATWYKISDVYVGVSKIAELRGSAESKSKIFVPPVPMNNWREFIPTVKYFDDYE